MNCFCHFCGHPLRFQISRVGQAVNCLNCTMETVLFIPGLQSPYPEERYCVKAREISWKQNQFGLRTISGVIFNESGHYLDWVRVEFILYNSNGLPIGTTSDCLIDFSTQTVWQFNAPVSQTEAILASEPLLSCEYGRVAQPRPMPSTPGSGLLPEKPALVRAR